MGLFQQLFTQLTAQWSVAYHLFTVFSVAWALQVSFNQWRASSFPQVRRAVIGLTGLLAVQVILFIAAGLAQAGILSASVLLPPLDRAAILVGLVFITWLWAFPETSRLADAAVTLFNLLIVCLAVWGVLQWSHEGAGQTFNGSSLDVVAHGIAIGLALLGCIALLLRRPNLWGVGLGMLFLALGGNLIHWFFPIPNNDYAGAVRLAQMAAYPLLLALPLRFPLTIEPRAVVQKPQPLEKRRYSVDPRLVQSIFEITTETSNEQAYRHLTRLISQMMLADLCFLVLAYEESRQLVVTCGYDLIREKTVDGFSLDERISPIITSALQRHRPARLPASSTSPDLLAFANALGLGRVGHMLIVPMPRIEAGTLMGLVLLSPYSNRGWTTEDQSYLVNLNTVLARLLQRTDQASALSEELTQVRQALQTAQAESANLKKQLNSLQAEAESARNRASQAEAKATSLAAIVDQQQAPIAGQPPPSAEAEQIEQQLRQALEELSRLRAENLEYQEKLQHAAQSTDEVSQVESQLRISLEEIARLNERLYESDQKLLELQLANQRGAGPLDNVEVVASMAQELRQPLSSILGYTDLLLGESVGILGAMQRKFVERVKAATERMGALVEDLVRLTVLEKGKLELTPESVNLGTAIDEAITQSVAGFREKNIALRVELPEPMPEIRADRDALQQVLVHLLQNAGQATPANGEVALSARVEDSDRQACYVLIQVADSGEGIPPDELPRVFSRLYRADNPLVPGVGDTGVGLSIAKSLVEAQGGRIWVDSERGRGSTFSVLLPMTLSEGAQGGGGNGGGGKS